MGRETKMYVFRQSQVNQTRLRKMYYRGKVIQVVVGVSKEKDSPTDQIAKESREPY